jgi:hypothetical protein
LGSLFKGEQPPARNMRSHQRAKEPPMIWYAQVQQFVDDDKVLEPFWFVQEIGGQGYGARA